MLIEIIQTGIPILCLIDLVIIMRKLREMNKTYNHIIAGHNVRIEAEASIIEVLKSDSMKAQESIKSLLSKMNSMEKNLMKSTEMLGEKIDEIHSLDDEERQEIFDEGERHARLEAEMQFMCENSSTSAPVKEKDK